MKKLLSALCLALALACDDTDPAGAGPDTEGPILEKVSAEPEYAGAGRTVEISVAANERLAKVEVKVAGRPATCPTPEGTSVVCSYLTAGTEGEGEMEVTAKASDPAGNSGEGSGSVVFDFTAPTVAITGAPLAVTNAETLEIGFEAQGADEVTCTLDGRQVAPCESPLTLSKLEDGSHVFAVIAADRAQNSATATADFATDRTPPDTHVSQAPPDLSRLADVEFAFSSLEPAARFECRFDGGAWSACESPRQLANVPEGEHDFEVRAIDEAGNLDATPAKVSFTLDRTAPKTTIDRVADDGKTSRSISFAADEQGATFECALDREAFAPCTSARSLTGLSEGEHRFSVRASDPAGNVEEPAAATTFVVDVTAPRISFAKAPPPVAKELVASFELASDEPASFECSLDGAAFAACGKNHQITLDGDGDHVLEVLASDKYLNKTPKALRHAWTVDALSPSVTFQKSPGQFSRAASAEFAFSASKPSTFTCALDGAAPSPCSSPLTLTGLSEGPHRFLVTATDPDARVGTGEVRWTVDTLAPAVTFDQAPGRLSNSAKARFAFSSEEGASFECSLDGGAFVSCDSPEEPSVDEGDHTFSVRATDPAGNAGAPAVHTWTVDLTAPAAPEIVQPDPSLISTPEPDLAWKPVATADNFTLELSFTPDFQQVTQRRAGMDDLGFRPTPLTSGRYYFRVRATDAAGNDSAWSRTGIFEVRTWTFASPRPHGSTVLGVSCTSAQKCWLVGEAGLAARTSDGGATFKLSSTGVTGSVTGVHMFDESTGVATAPKGEVLRTEDGGVTWSAVASGVSADLYGLSFKGKTGYVVGDAGTVLRTEDGGKTWLKLPSGTSASLRDVAILDDACQVAVAVGGSGAVVRTENGGATFSAGSSGTTVQLRAVSFANASVGWAVGANASGNTARKTTDGGKTWLAQSTGSSGDLYDVHFTDEQHGWIVGESSSTNSIASIRRTENGGASWANAVSIPGGAFGPITRTLRFVGGTQAAWAGGEGGALLVSADAGASFAPASGVVGAPTGTANQDLRAVQFVSPTKGFVFGGSGFAMRTDDGGRTFTALPSTPFTATRGIFAASFPDATNGWAGGDGNFVARTTDGGQSWTALTGLSIYVRGIHFKSAAVGALVGTSGKVLRWNPATSSFDAEKVYSSAGAELTSSLRAVKLVDAGHGFLVGDGGLIARYDAAGKKWVQEASGTSDALFGLWAFDADNAIAVGDKGRLLVRTSSGWTVSASGTSANLKDVTFADAGAGWVVGDGTILATTDGGRTWKRQLSPTGSTLQAAAAPTPNLVFAVGGGRAILRTEQAGR